MAAASSADTPAHVEKTPHEQDDSKVTDQHKYTHFEDGKEKKEDNESSRQNYNNAMAAASSNDTPAHEDDSKVTDQHEDIRHENKEKKVNENEIQDTKPEDNITNRQNYNNDSDAQGNDKNPGDVLEAALAQLGHFRLYQAYVVVMLCIPNLLAPMYALNYVFVADQVPFRCIVPECEGISLDFHNSTATALLPEDAACHRYIPLGDDLTSCAREQFHPNDTQQCDLFIYENQDTIFAEFDLACREWLRTMVGSVHNAAIPFALLLTGYVSDSYGRRTAFCIFALFSGIIGIIRAYSINYQMFIAMEFLEAALGYGFTSAGYVIVVELARPSLRVAFACATGVAYGVGGMVFALTAWLVLNWRSLLIITHVPALMLPLYWLVLDESPRWLHATGKTDRTAAVVRKAARWNKVKLDEDLMKALEKECLAEGSQKRGNPWLSLVRSRVLLGRFALCCWCWVAVAFVYYGLTINSVSLSGDKYVNFALNMAMEVVASLMIAMSLERFGRRRSIFVAFLLCGVACVTPYFVSHTGTGLGLYFLGKLTITFAFNSIYVYTAELFPTATRSSALAACSLVGRIGSILAPQTPLLSVYVQALLYGISSLSAAVCVLLGPETRRARLPADVGDAETIHRGKPVEITPPVRTSVVVISADT